MIDTITNYIITDPTRLTPELAAELLGGLPDDAVEAAVRGLDPRHLGQLVAIYDHDDNGVTRTRDRQTTAAKTTPAATIRRARSTGGDREEVIMEILRERPGLAVSDITADDRLDCSRDAVSRALSAAVRAGRICRGGDRRFARYAMTQLEADRASRAARGI